MKKQLTALLLCSVLLSGALPDLAGNVLAAQNTEDSEEITVLFTHDTHDYLYPTTSYEYGEKIDHGGAAKLATLLQEYSDENTIYVDGGDFSMGTLMQATYSSDAYELRNLGILGCDVTTLGNHEFDYGLSGLTDMLKNAMESGDELPKIVQANMNLSGEMTEEQKEFQEVCQEYGIKEYTSLEVSGVKIGILGLSGIDSIECTQADISFHDYIETAKTTVEKMKADGCQVIIALSHSGTNGDGETGEDFDLAKAVPEIDIIISAHSHSEYDSLVMEGDTVIASTGSYLKNLGKLSFTVTDGDVDVESYDYSMIRIDENVEEDPETSARIESYEASAADGYLKDYGYSFDQVICHSDYTLQDIKDMYATQQEFAMGNIIADSYQYIAKQNGIDDIDVALVGLGTIRTSIREGDITVADAFEICSLGVGSDGSAGHSLITGYITGKELKLLTELDASLGNYTDSIKMSYSGLSYTFNTRRILLDRVTDVHLVRADGSTEKIEDKKLYKVCINMYAANMLGMLNGLTKGILSISPKDEMGNVITDFNQAAMIGSDGKEVKEWVALTEYLSSFDKGESGYAELPEEYSENMGRKVKVSEGGLAVISHPGTATKIIPIVIGVAVVLLLLLILLITAIVKWLRKRSRRGSLGRSRRRKSHRR